MHVFRRILSLYVRVCLDIPVLCFLQSNPTSIDKLYRSSHFSPLYKIVIESKNDNQPMRTLGKYMVIASCDL